MSAPQALIFDIGNVLVFHDNDLLHRRLAALAGVSVARLRSALQAGDFARRATLGLLDGPEMHAEFCRLLDVDCGYERFRAVFSSHFTRNQSIEPLIAQLQGRYRLLTLSNTNALHVDYLLEHVPLLGRFDSLLLSCEVGLAKPDPPIYAEAVRRAALPAGACLYVDDLPAYVTAGAAAGLQALRFRDTQTLTCEFAAAGVQ